MLPEYYTLVGVNMQEDILTWKILWNIVEVEETAEVTMQTYRILKLCSSNGKKNI